MSPVAIERVKTEEMWNQLTKYTLYIYYQNESIILLYENSLISKKRQILFILFVNIKSTKEKNITCWER